MPLDIRFCRLDELAKLQRFIRDEWSSDHIFVYSVDLLDYQHRTRETDRYNFVVAADEHGSFQAILGFIPPGHFGDEAEGALWLSLWKTGARCADKGAGLALLRFLEREVRHDTIITAGISAQARSIYKVLRFQVHALQHYYLAIHARPDGIALGLRSNERPLADGQVPLAPGAMNHTAEEQALSAEKYRYRGLTYFREKYEKHPSYQYQLVHAPLCDISLVFRLVDVPNKGRAMRLIDCGGNLGALPRVMGAIVAMAKAAGVEYVDILAHWPLPEDLENAGFRRVQDEIVPNYFEPFVQKNVTIEFAVKNRDVASIAVFKGDGDQDRPSRIPGVNV